MTRSPSSQREGERYCEELVVLGELHGSAVSSDDIRALREQVRFL